MKETSSSLLADAGVTGYYSNTTTTDQDEVYLEEMVFYVKLAQGHEPIDCGDDSLVITIRTSGVTQASTATRSLTEL